MKDSGDLAKMRAVKLAFKCTGLQCSPTASFHAGMLTGLLNRAKGTTTAKNEKRYIIVSLSNTSSGDFRDVYKSEIIENSYDICPSLVADIKFGNIAESYLRMRILYISNLTGGKEVIVGDATSSLKEIVNSRHLRLSLSSPYLKTMAVLDVKLIEPFRPLLQHSSFAPIAMKNPGNPYRQPYVFYHEESTTVPSVYCEEFGFETRISCGAVIAFLDECLRAISLSKNAWIARANYEKTRQGQFSSLGEALKQGWHQVVVTVIEAKIPIENEGFSQNSKNSSGIFSQDNDIVDFSGDLDKNGSRGGLRKVIQNFAPGSSTKRSKFCDETKPSTFVEISISRSPFPFLPSRPSPTPPHTSTFIDPVGLTNTEYFTSKPVYGSNFNASNVKHPRTEHQTCGDGVSLLSDQKSSHPTVTGTPDSSSMSPGTGTGGVFRGPGPGTDGSAVEGSAMKFVRYVPTRKDSAVIFSLNQMLSDTNYSQSDHSRGGKGMGELGKRLAQCSIALDCPTLAESSHDNMDFSRCAVTRWLTADSPSVSPNGQKSPIEVLVTVEIISPSARSINHNNNATSPLSSHESSNSKVESFPGCREYEYQIGYEAADPLVMVKTLTPTASSLRVPEAASLGPSRGCISDDVDLLSLSDYDSPKQELPPSFPLSPAINDSSSHSNHLMQKDADLNELPCTDYPYPLGWLDNHINQLENVAKEILTARNNAQDLVQKGTGFRPSTAKKIMTHQAVPVNLHMQVMAVRSTLHSSPDLSSDTADPAAEGVLDAMTCGCLSPHGLGFGQKKGLDAMESSLEASRVRIDVLKGQLGLALEQAQFGGPEEGRHTPAGMESHVSDALFDYSPQRVREKGVGKPSSASLSRRSAAFEIFENMGREVLDYETAMLSVCRRRTFAVSQAISIAVSAVLMKLTLVAEKHIPQEVGEGWLTHGFLLVFEGLLSVIGSEKFMLEDTVSAVEALSEYQIRILPALLASEKQHDLDDVIRFEADHLSSGDVAVPVAEVGMRGREVLLYLPPGALSALPLSYQERAADGGAVLKIVAVLFSQGIDIQQTLALAATSFSAMASKPSSASTDKDSSSGAATEDPTVMRNLQYVVNVRGLALLEEYCCQFRPIDGDRDGSNGSGGASFEPSAAAAAKEQHDKYRSSLPSPTQRGRQTRAAATTRNLTMAMHLTSAATSAAGSAVRAYGASYFKNSADTERGARTTTSSLNPNSPQSLPSHPLLEELTETVLSSSNIHSKNVDLLVAVERVCVMLGGCRVTFCKSGKDRTGMAVTYEQSRQLGERFGCGQSLERVLRDANLMRIHGVRIMIAEKNIGRRVYSINQLQAQFLPAVYRPPKEVLEDLMRKDDT